MGLVQTGAPSTEPLTTAEAKTHLRITFDDDNTYIDTLVASAREWAETVTSRQMVTATWSWTMDGFPRTGRIIDVPHPPLASVTSIAYVDNNGDSQTWDSSNYDVDTTAIQGRISEAYGVSWPSTRRQMNAVTIVFVAGFGAASAVPPSVKRAMLFLVGHWYENRENVVVGTITKQIEDAAEALLSLQSVPVAM